MKPKSIIPLAILVSSLAIGAASGATVIFSDTFADGGRTAGAGGEADITWAAVNTLTSIGIVQDNSNGFSGNALSVVPADADSNFVFDGTYGVFNTSTGVALAATVGHSIQVQFSFRWNTTVTGSELRFGLYNNGATSSTADNNSAYNNDAGYRFALLQTGGGTGGLSYEVGTGNTPPGQGSTGTLTSQTAGTAALDMGTTGHTFLYTLTRRADNGIDISAAMDGNVFRSGTDAAANVSSYHAFYIGTGSSNLGDFRIDNVSMTVIPEPSAALLGAIGTLALLRRRR